jgi:hypothetical protein
LQEAAIRVGAVPGVFRAGSRRVRSRCHPPESLTEMEFDKRPEGGSLERWQKLARTFSAVSFEDHRS